MNKQNLNIHVVDAFVGEGLAGNPAGVCPLESWLPDETMQAVAREMGLSETAFFAPRDDGYLLRWFTPTTEVDLCGHATLASAAVFFADLDGSVSAVRFHTLKSGSLTVTRDGALMELDFPARPAAPVDNAGIGAALGAAPVETLLLPGKACLAVYAHEDEVRALAPDMERVAAIGAELDIDAGAELVIATAPGTRSDFVSRVFAPRAGIPEDPVTGAAHTTLVPYWSARLGKAELHALQVSDRGGELFCTARGGRVGMAGRAVIRQSGTVDVAGAAPRAELVDA
ncbi:MAG: PhzF family phenazine biosynthesis protein [Alphaproteobacteria bacterium]|nr:PhzF family phenazine biosynthesis protein [Alphaproteobacteria bacterium]